MNATDLVDKRVLVAGLGVTGRSVLRWLTNAGIRCDVMDAGTAAADLPPGTALFDDLSGALATPCDVIVLSPGIPRRSEGLERAMADGCLVIGDIELFAGAARAPVIAVTGSNGKSTVVAWLAESLVAAGVRAVACGNIGEAALDALADEVELYVLELSSYQLESTDSLAPLAACVLNVSEDHLDRYDGFAHYAATKRRVYHGAAHRIVNAQDAQTWPDSTPRAADACISVKEAPPASGSGTASMTRWHLSGGTSGSLCRDGRLLLEAGALALPGLHNVFNALAVLALASVALERLHGAVALPGELLKALARFTGLPHRTERVARIDGVSWYDDSKGTNVDACVRAIEAMPGPVVLIAGGLGKGADFTPIAHRASALRAVVLIGRDAPQLAAVLDPVTRVQRADTLEAAVDQAGRLAEPGDAVLLSPACASFDMFKDFIARGRAFQNAVRARAPAGAIR